MVIRPPRQKLGNFRPFVAEVAVELDDVEVFVVGPLILLNPRIKMIMPPLPTLLSNPPRQI
jgi:hypothetical protein